jgi:hypothetical protein
LSYKNGSIAAEVEFRLLVGYPDCCCLVSLGDHEVDLANQQLPISLANRRELCRVISDLQMRIDSTIYTR